MNPISVFFPCIVLKDETYLYWQVSLFFLCKKMLLRKRKGKDAFFHSPFQDVSVRTACDCGL